MENIKRNILILCSSLIGIGTVTFLARFLKYIDILWLKILAKVFLNLMNGAIAYISMKLMKMQIQINLKNKKQYLIGAGMALALSGAIAIIPSLCGVSLVGNHMDFSWFSLVYDFLFCMLIIGPVEELIFRVYLQDVFISFFKHCKWIGVILTALLFGLWHLINGGIIQVLFTFGIGLAFGFAKYKIKECSYISVAFGHGLYDFLITLVRMFIV